MHRSKNSVQVFDIPWRGEQSTKAFPDIPGGQLHIGAWLNTLHNAFCPQTPTQGSIHLFLTQALLIGHSLLRTHSGLQPAYGSPEYSGKQVQIPLSQRAFDPQGEDAHGSVSIGSATII